MDTGLVVAIVVVLVLLALLAFFAGRQRRSRNLQDTFGPEYDRTVEQTGDRRAADLSVDHPQVVDDYRAAHAIAAANDRSEASTEDLRQALVHYRSLFEELLEDRHPDRSTTEEAR